MTTLPAQAWRMLAHDGITREDRKVHRGADALAVAAAGAIRRRRLSTAAFLRDADRVLALEADHAALSEPALNERLADLRALFRRGRDTPEDRVRAFAAVREAAFRVTGLRAYRVQVAGAIAITAGCIAEMATGEGKTLTATMPAAIAGWRGKGCHVFTANDYLATRDAATLAPVYRRLGLTAAAISGELGLRDRRAAYAADVTYCTSKEAAADYLRDRLALGRIRGLPSALIASLSRADTSSDVTRRILQRGLASAIVDEADFVLIDEAVTPLIVSEASPGAAKPDAFRAADRLAAAMHEGEHFTLDRMHREVELTSAGRQTVESAAGEDGLGVEWSVRRRREEMVAMALSARHLYARDAHYIVRDDQVVIVDESTGRLMPDRTWRDGLHQAVEAKEGLTVREVKETRARISFQKFFRMYRHLGGMSGTVAESAGELWHVYRAPVVRIPTNRPVARVTFPMQVLPNADAKWAGVVEEVLRVRAHARPILVGTRTVGESEQLSAMLRDAAIDHAVLNAVRHREEAAVIARAGESGRVTVATNMAGRGTDITLSPAAREAGGLHVIATTLHESARIDRQLAGRAGRQGDPGSVRVFVSLEDELPARYADAPARLLASISPSGARAALRRAQARAARHARAMRAAVLKSDEWLDEWLGFAGRE